MKKLLLLSITLLSLQLQAQSRDEGSTPEPQAQCWKQIDAGGFCVVGIKEDGTLWGWGRNFSGELGDSPDPVAIPVQIGTDDDWSAVSSGNGHNMALKTDGTLWAWGRNDSGQVGNGIITIFPNPAPVQIGTDSDWAFICAGHVHSTAIKNNGTLWTWGANNTGQLGIGTIDTGIPQTIIPAQVGTDTDWKFIDASWTQNVALKTDGSLWEWGVNAYLPMSNGSVTPVLNPIQIGTATDWAQAAVGGFAISAIKEDGTLWSWGFNFSGGVGVGNNTNIMEPQQIGSDKWKSVVRGMNYFAGAIKEDGTLWTWGYNYYGAVGNGATDNATAPVQIASDVAWKSYQGAGDYSVALKEDGSLLVWGYNWYDELGFNLEGNTVLNPALVETCTTTAGLNENLLTQIFLYPNPTSNILNLTNADNISIEKLIVIDPTGKVVITQNGNSHQLDVQQLPAGMYFLHVTASEGSQHIKFIKQ